MQTTQGDRILNEQDKTVIANHPLAEVMGKFEGEFWDEMLAEIQQLRDQDRRELEISLDIDEKWAG